MFRLTTAVHYALLLTLSRSITFVANQTSCLREAGGADPPFTDDKDNPVIPSGTPEGVLAIIPTYTFNCCANVTEWRTIVQPGGRNHRDGVYSVGFQVYRPSAEGNRCYYQVEQNNFDSVTVDDGCITETVQPSDYISVQPGDIVGISVASTNGGNEGVQLEESLNNNKVYYISSYSMVANPGYFFSLNGSSEFTMRMAAPMLSVTLAEFPCPTPSIAMPTTDSELNSQLTTNPTNTSGIDPTGSAGTSSHTNLIFTTHNTVVGSAETGNIVVGVAASVVVLLVVIVGGATALIIVIIVRRRKKKSNQENNLELSNPNYTYDGTRRQKKTDDDETLYHAVGPRPQTANTNPGSPSINQESGNKISGVYDEPHLDNSVYDDPTLPNFRIQDTRQNMGLFEEVGYYVPTLEERSDAGLKLYDSTPASNYNKLNFFVEDHIYWAPANTAPDLYSQLASKKYREIPRNQIKLHTSLGSGQFGEVHKATWSIGKQKMELAVKTLKSGASEEDQVKFLQEAAIMGQFSHNNVIKMYGVVTLGEPVLLCAEILENGDLRNYLTKSALKESKKKGIQQTLLKFAKDIAAGMNYLSKKCFVHRDLAARNILINKNLTCKVADFGMARDLMDDTYYTSSGGKIPVKWTAPEALLYKKYSTDSDVWSYGMVLFEIWSVGKKPFANLTNPQVLRLLQTGYCQPPPPGCPRAIFQLMVDCWNPDHQSRPKFSDISQRYLQQPSSSLLHWSPEDNRISPQVGVYGAPLHEAERLYIDLQHKYEGCQKI